MTTKKYISNPLLLFVSLATAITLLVLSVVMIIIKNYIALVVFVILAGLFLHEAILYGRVAEVSEEGIKRTFLGKTEVSIPWDEVKQVGLSGTRVFMNDFLGGNGTIYIYASKEELDDEQIFNMMLDWPPKDKVYMRYDADRLATVKTFFPGGIKKYKTGKLKIYNSKE